MAEKLAQGAGTAADKRIDRPAPAPRGKPAAPGANAEVPVTLEKPTAPADPISPTGAEAPVGDEVKAAVEPPPKVEKTGLKRILSDFGQGTKDLFHFVFVEERAQRRQELVESLRFYVTYK